MVTHSKNNREQHVSCFWLYSQPCDSVDIQSRGPIIDLLLPRPLAPLVWPTYHAPSYVLQNTQQAPPPPCLVMEERRSGQGGRGSRQAHWVHCMAAMDILCVAITISHVISAHQAWPKIGPRGGVGGELTQSRQGSYSMNSFVILF